MAVSTFSIFIRTKVTKEGSINISCPGRSSRVSTFGAPKLWIPDLLSFHDASLKGLRVMGTTQFTTGFQPLAAWLPNWEHCTLIHHNETRERVDKHTCILKNEHPSKPRGSTFPPNSRRGVNLPINKKNSTNQPMYIYMFPCVPTYHLPWQQDITDTLPRHSKRFSFTSALAPPPKVKCEEMRSSSSKVQSFQRTAGW